MSPESITIYPYDPFDIDYGITFLNVQCKEEYTSFLFVLNQLKKHETFVDDIDQYIHFYVDEKDNLKTSLKQVAMIGDLTSFELNSTGNLKLVLQKIVFDNQIINQDRIEKLNHEINELIFDSTSSYDETFEYDLLPELIKLLKSKDFKIDSSNWQNYYDKLQSVVRFYVEFSDKRLLLFHGLERLCSLEQLNELNDYLKSIKLAVVSLESYPMTLKKSGLNTRIYSIDEDHVRFDY
ncbi:type II-A CRISPR-associated protein Csn2 [Companilactobacillus jidongensis]|uniref:type II-A CRISPR-associated protein Csn2 n=1 Tax=Companilactobacillus jidongensis TaxID=2486006 RepID=UPI000F784240|nr:type II-A CRISPR-associated protein Csn2 [Companilactobacillus jidongensis]